MLQRCGFASNALNFHVIPPQVVHPEDIVIMKQTPGHPGLHDDVLCVRVHVCVCVAQRSNIGQALPQTHKPWQTHKHQPIMNCRYPKATEQPVNNTKTCTPATRQTTRQKAHLPHEHSRHKTRTRARTRRRVCL